MQLVNKPLKVFGKQRGARALKTVNLISEKGNVLQTVSVTVSLVGLFDLLMGDIILWRY